MAPGHPHRHHHGPLRRVGAIIALLAFVALAMPLRAQDGLYRAKSPIEIDRTSQHPRLVWFLNMQVMDSIMHRRGDSIARRHASDSIRALVNGITWRFVPSAIRPTGTLGQVLKVLPDGTVGFAPDSAGSGGASGRIFLDSYTSNALTPGLAYIDSTGKPGYFLLQFPNFDSESFGGAANFANTGLDDSSRFPLNGTAYIYQWTYPVYLDRAHIIVQWGSGAGKAEYSISGLPPLGIDSGLVVHLRYQGGARYLRFYRRAVARGYSFVHADPHLVFLHEQQVSSLTGGTWPTAGTSVQVLIRIRARRKHL